MCNSGVCSAGTCWIARTARSPTPVKGLSLRPLGPSTPLKAADPAVSRLSPGPRRNPGSTGRLVLRPPQRCAGTGRCCGRTILGQAGSSSPAGGAYPTRWLGGGRDYFVALVLDADSFSPPGPVVAQVVYG